MKNLVLNRKKKETDSLCTDTAPTHPFIIIIQQICKIIVSLSRVADLGGVCCGGYNPLLVDFLKR